MLLAFTRAVPPTIDRCELTHLAREPIDYARAVAEHDAYEAALRRLGCLVERLPDAPELPDSVFVEDTAVVFDEIAVIARPGAVSRRPEIEAVRAALARRRRVLSIDAPGTLDGGDVLVTPGRVFVGISGRTNVEGARQLAAFAEPFGFEVLPIPVTGCLHLKSAVTLAQKPASGRPVLVVNPAWVDVAHFAGYALIEVNAAEPFGANVLPIGDTLLCAEEHPRTRRRLEARGLRTTTVSAGELAKAEGGLTCGALILDRPPTSRQ